MPDERAGAERRPVVVGPAEGVAERRQEQAGVGDPSRDHHVGPGVERRQERIGAEIGIGADQWPADLADRQAGVRQRRVGADQGAYVVALERGDLQAVQAEVARHLRGPGRGTARIGDPHVGDQPGAVRDAERQDGAQAPLEERIVAGIRVRHAIAMAERKRALADAFEHDRIELSLGDQVHRRVETIGREPGAGAEAELITRGHLVSLARARGGGQPSLHASMTATP
jgi:hypothetical protein